MNFTRREFEVLYHLFFLFGQISQTEGFCLPGWFQRFFPSGDVSDHKKIQFKKTGSQY